MIPYKAPTASESAFNCPFCNAYAKQAWTNVAGYERMPGGGGEYISIKLDKSYIATCEHCHKSSIWIDEVMVYPYQSIAPLANDDMPDEVRFDYEEARNILMQSPRGAAALLRLALQKLCLSLGEKGENINEDIKNLVNKGLPIKVQQALDSVRVIGNNAVHPGVIDLKDNIDLASKLFGLVNIICDVMISQPKAIDELYTSEVPESDKEAIKKRDGIES